ncbi:transcription factor Pcc1 [Sistotremastrum niveocremeum HHB9708]|uniref:Transcription factor Pcc1 n=2 Tax=Sistotremastraceae TaxID=3402574 RepID=A0A164VLJ9_9AGAM|nr:transcription factor Pcc1 [Sistotremastrum niveocremeum HHB9708]KZT41213.1 transcription factor Pcc1 [Sistotremastrum suecicum HHB10207 ss-3]
MAAESGWHTLDVRVPFVSNEHAEIARRVIDVDPELQPSSVKRHLKVEDNVLVASFSTLTVRLARLTINSFLENLDLVIRTIGEFGDDAAASA